MIGVGGYPSGGPPSPGWETRLCREYGRCRRHYSSPSVEVIDTASNTSVAAVATVPNRPDGVAITPDGQHVYVTNPNSNNVSVIDTATNTVEPATIMVASVPVAVGIVPPPVGALRRLQRQARPAPSKSTRTRTRTSMSTRTGSRR